MIRHRIRVWINMFPYRYYPGWLIKIYLDRKIQRSNKYIREAIAQWRIDQKKRKNKK